jgi:type IV secretion system protein VirB4
VFDVASQIDIGGPQRDRGAGEVHLVFQSRRSNVMSGRDTASLETGAGAKAANNSVDDLSEVICSLDKKAQGEYSLRLLLAARSAEQLRDTIPAVHRVFVDARAQMMEETLGNLSAFYALFPGNYKFNVFPQWLSEDHHARLSSVFAPHIGHPHSEDLDSEYLNIFETRMRTPFFQDVYVDGVRVMLIVGPTGTGKSVHGNQLISLEQKYGGFTYIFDIGASYESVVELYGGKVDRVGKDGPKVNPFALEPTESNIKFLYSFIKLLLTNGGAELEPEDDGVIHKAVQICTCSTLRTGVCRIFSCPRNSTAICQSGLAMASITQSSTTSKTVSRSLACSVSTSRA